jgi:hypothetical protein
MHDELKRALRALHLDGLAFNIRGDAGGIATGLLPTRDIDLPSLEHREENFAAHVRVARVVVSHDPFGVDRTEMPDRCGRAAGSSPTRRPGGPASTRARSPDDRLAVEILQLDLELVAAAGMLDRCVAADVALDFSTSRTLARIFEPGVETLDLLRICALRMRVRDR